jgi:hypothetical protein
MRALYGSSTAVVMYEVDVGEGALSISCLLSLCRVGLSPLVSRPTWFTRIILVQRGFISLKPRLIFSPPSPPTSPT